MKQKRIHLTKIWCGRYMKRTVSWRICCVNACPVVDQLDDDLLVTVERGQVKSSLSCLDELVSKVTKKVVTEN